MPKAFITGINGQDGSYLTELLLSKNYEVHGLYRKFLYTNLNLILEKNQNSGKTSLHFLSLFFCKKLNFFCKMQAKTEKIKKK